MPNSPETKGNFAKALEKHAAEEAREALLFGGSSDADPELPQPGSPELARRVEGTGFLGFREHLEEEFGEGKIDREIFRRKIRALSRIEQSENLREQLDEEFGEGNFSREEFRHLKSTLESSFPAAVEPEPTPREPVREPEPWVVEPEPRIFGPTPEPGFREKAKEILQSFSKEDLKKAGSGFRNLGFLVEENKNRLFSFGFKKLNEKFAVEGENADSTWRASTGRFFQALQKNYEKDAERVHKRMEGAEGKGIRKELFNISYLATNAVKVARQFALPLNAIIWGGWGLARGAEAAKEARLGNEEVMEKTRIHDMDEALEAAWQIYEKANDLAGRDMSVRVGMEKENLEKSYTESIPRDLIKRLSQSKERNVLSTFWRGLFEWDLFASAQVIDFRLEGVEENDRLTSAEKRKKKDQILQRYEKHLKDLDRMVTQAGTVDMLALGARYAETTGKAVVGGAVAYALEQGFEKIWAGLPDLWTWNGKVTPPVKAPEPEKVPAPARPAPLVPEAPKPPAVPEAPAPAPEAAKPAPEAPKVAEGPEPEKPAPPETPKPEFPPAAISNIEVAKEGDSIWKMAERQLAARLGERFDNLGEAQKTYITDAIKDKIVADMENPDVIKIGQSIDFSKALADDRELEQLMGQAEGLSPEQAQNIEKNNQLLRDRVAEHPGEKLSSQKIDKILSGTLGSADEAPSLPPRPSDAKDFFHGDDTQDNVTAEPPKSPDKEMPDLEQKPATPKIVERPIPDVSQGVDDAWRALDQDQELKKLRVQAEVPAVPETPFGSSTEAIYAKILDFNPPEYNAIKNITVEKLLKEIPEDEEGRITLWKNFTRTPPDLPHTEMRFFGGYFEGELKKQMRLAEYIRATLKPDASMQKMTISEYFKGLGENPPIQ